MPNVVFEFRFGIIPINHRNRIEKRLICSRICRIGFFVHPDYNIIELGVSIVKILLKSIIL